MPGEADNSADRFPFKVELHTHLDGFVRDQTVLELSRAEGINLPIQRDEDIKQVTSVTVPGDFALFLTKFDAVLPLIAGRKEIVRRIGLEFCEDCARENIKYVEVRYSPHFLSNEVENFYLKDKTSTLTTRDVVVELLNAFREGSEKHKITVKTILCCIMSKPKWSQEILDLCKEFKNDGVVAIDIAAGEHNTPEEDTLPHVNAFKEAERCGIHRTAHAGEIGPAAYVKEVLDDMKAERIGHGYNTLQCEELYKRVLDEQIHLECCPCSSYGTGAVHVDLDCKQHPIKRFIEDGANVSINSDDGSIFDCSLLDNYKLVLKMGFSDREIIKCIFNAARSCFAPEEEKLKLLADLKDVYGDSY